MFVGIGTVTNVLTVVVGSGLGLLIGHRLALNVRTTVTAALGLVTLLIAAQGAMAVSDDTLSAAVGDSAPMLIVLGALVLGGIIGSLLHLEQRIETFGGWLQSRLTRGDSADVSRDRFIEGFVISRWCSASAP
ncbi:DUF554 family protein [Aeromicrobium sp. UC242_57]|uniref:DUF554 family protein n=1 Tax=Aeromicrobium sp. UC242_57 TaxID=3374624 RepID=UPI0037B96A93